MEPIELTAQIYINVRTEKKENATMTEYNNMLTEKCCDNDTYKCLTF